MTHQTTCGTCRKEKCENFAYGNKCKNQTDETKCHGDGDCGHPVPTNEQRAREAVEAGYKEQGLIRLGLFPTLDECLINALVKALTLKDREAQEKVERVVRALEDSRLRKGIAVHVGTSVGKYGTNSGPISQAREDGYDVAYNDALAAARQDGGEKECPKCLGKPPHGPGAFDCACPEGCPDACSGKEGKG